MSSAAGNASPFCCGGGKRGNNLPLPQPQNPQVRSRGVGFNVDYRVEFVSIHLLSSVSDDI